MSKTKRGIWLIPWVLGLGIGLTALEVGASAGDPDPNDPPAPVSGPGPAGDTAGSQKKIPPKQIQQVTERFVKSLHATRKGKARFYNAYWDLDGDGVLDDNGGFEHLAAALYGARADYDNLACKNCHYPPALLAGLAPPPPSPGDCTDCHWNAAAGDYGVPANRVAFCDINPDPNVVAIGICPVGYDPVKRFSTDGVCLGCHSRQAADHTLFTDVHRAIDAANPGDVAKFTCMGCHKETEVHGDGTAPDAHLDSPKVSCAQAGCHERELQVAGGKKKKATSGACIGDGGGINTRCETFHNQHVADVDCTACHVQSNSTCNSCHFDSELDGRKRYYRQIPSKGFLFLMNFKDIQDPTLTRVRSANYQSLTVGAVCTDGSCATENAQTFTVFAPYASHSVTKGEGLKCRDCHVIRVPGGYEGNAAVVEYLTKGTVTTTVWNPGAGIAGLLEGPKGIIPLPPDWISADGTKGTLDMDFAYYLGNTTNLVTKDLEGDDWAFLKTGPDRGHMPYGTPLSADQMQDLILDAFPDE
jgi:hypothetical protein